MEHATIGVGIIGLRPDEGWAQRAHLPALRAIGGYEVRGVANSSPDSSRSAAEAFGLAHAYPNAEEMAADPAIDLVAVTVKVPHHRALVEPILAAGKMVYCEWPLGNGLAEAERLLAAARTARVRTLVGLQARSAPVVRYVRDLIAEGAIGEVLSTTMVGSGGNWGATVGARDAYTHDATNGANLLTIPFGHAIDALCFCLGEVRQVEATTAMRRRTFRIAETGEERPMATDDQIAVTGLLEGGTVLVVHYRGGSSRATNLRWEINGTDGDLEITAGSGHLQLTSTLLRGAMGADKELKPMDVPGRYRFGPDGLQGGAVNVAEAYAQFIRGETAAYPVPGFEEAVVRHRLLDAIERAARSGERVML